MSEPGRWQPGLSGAVIGVLLGYLFEHTLDHLHRLARELRR